MERLCGSCAWCDLLDDRVGICMYDPPRVFVSGGVAQQNGNMKLVGQAQRPAVLMARPQVELAGSRCHNWEPAAAIETTKKDGA